jgi:hypothetical protein
LIEPSNTFENQFSFLLIMGMLIQLCLCMGRGAPVAAGHAIATGMLVLYSLAMLGAVADRASVHSHVMALYAPVAEVFSLMHMVL